MSYLKITFRKSNFLNYFFLGLFLLLAGCEKKPEQAIIIGMNNWPGYEPAYISEVQKYYEDADVQLRQLGSATEVIRYFRNGAIDVAALTLDEALILKQRGMDIKIIMIADISNGADAIIAKPPITDIAQLKGRTVGVEDSALGAYVLTRALQVNNIPEQAVKRLHLTIDETSSAYETGQVDAVVTFEPYKSQLIAKGGRELFSSKEIPNEIIDVLVVQSDFAENNPVVLKKMVAGWQRAVDFLKNNEAAAFGLIARRQNVSVEGVRESFKGLHIPDAKENLALLQKNSPILQANEKHIYLLEQRYGLKIEANVNDMLSNAFLPNE